MTSEPASSDTAHPIGTLAWALLAAATLVTFVAFILLDPAPSLLLAFCASANVGLMVFATYRLYQWQLLLSPIASVVIGPGLILYYSWGNLGARVAGEGRFGSNPGSLEFYPVAALLCTLGLALFNGAVFGLFARQFRARTIRYADLYWKPWQAPVAAGAAVALLVHLSLNYEFVNGYFLDVQNDVDRWLSASHYFFVLLAVIIGVSVTVRARGVAEHVFGLAGIVLPLALALGLRSRTFMVAVVVMSACCWLTLRPRHVRAVVLVGVAATALVFSLGTVVKVASIQGETSAVSDNLTVVSAADLTTVAEDNRGSALLDVQYRLAGFEMPAALIGSMERGTTPLYGEGLYGGLLSGLPGFVRPAGEFSERLAILSHFYGRGLLFGDSIGVPLTSGLADWGILASPLIYIVIAGYCLILWRLAQLSPRLFVAYLMAGVGPGDLFWENSLFAPRAIGFAFLVLLVTGPLLMPSWRPHSGHATAPTLAPAEAAPRSA